MSVPNGRWEPAQDGREASSEAGVNGRRRSVSLQFPQQRDYDEAELTLYRQGFFCALAADETPTMAFEKGLEDLKSERNGALLDAQAQADLRLKPLADERDYLLDEQRRQREQSARDPVQPTDVSDNLPLETRISELRRRLYTLEHDRVPRRREALDHAFQEAFESSRANADRVMDAALQLGRVKHDINRKAFEDSQAALTERQAYLRDRIGRTRAVAAQVSVLVNHLAAAGLTRTTIALVTWMGALGLVAAGWFFSVFTANGALDSQDYASFLVARILNALDRTFARADPFLMLFTHVVAWLALLALVGALYWCVDWLVARRQPTPDALVITVDGEGWSAYHRRWRLRFPTVLAALPWIFGAGLIAVLLAYFGPQDDDLDRLLRSLSGQFVGTVIAWVATGLYVLYVAHVVQPRLMRGDPAGFSWRRHWEIVLGFGVAAVVLGVFLAWQITDAAHLKATQPNTALAWYMAALCLTLPTLGFALWARGVYAEHRDFEREERRLVGQLEDCQRPRGLDTSAIDDSRFRTAWAERYAALLRLDRWITWARAPARSAWPWPFGLWANRDLAAFDRAHLPDLAGEIADTEADLQTLLAERRRLLERRAELRDRLVSPSAQNATRDRIGQLSTDLTGLREAEGQALERVRERYRNRETALRDGFNLGTWFLTVDVSADEGRRLPT